MQRYRRVHSLTTIWFSSIMCFFKALRIIKLKDTELGMGHFKEDEFYPEYSIIASEISLGIPKASVFYHLIRRFEKYTFGIFSNTSQFCWHVLESFINEFLPEMDTYKISKIGEQRNNVIYRRRGRCLEFVRCKSLKTTRTTSRRDPYPFTLRMSYSLDKNYISKQVEDYFRMFRLPVLIHRRINHWWLARKWWKVE